MTSRLKTIFPNEWEHILSVYKGFICFGVTQKADEGLLLTLLEIGVRFGERLSELHMNGFIEIGCGLAIPSLTLAKLGKSGRAVDVDSEVIIYVQNLKNHLECNLKIECRDIFENRPKLKKRELLIAEKPASYKKNILEVEYNIANWCKIEGHHLAMIPTYSNDDTLLSYSEKCEKYEKNLKQVGFKVENRQVCKKLPFRWLIATR